MNFFSAGFAAVLSFTVGPPRTASASSLQHGLPAQIRQRRNENARPRGPCARSLHPPPRKWGRGYRALARWKRRRTQQFSCDDNEAVPQRPPPPCFAWFPSPAFAGADKRNSFSRRDARPRFANNEANSQSPSQKRGKRSAERRIQPMSAPHRRTLPPANARGAEARQKSGRARLPALHRGTRQGSYPLAQLRAALPGITGCKREDPPRRQCSEHLADRS